MTTIDHKCIGVLYGVTALTFLLLGCVEALLFHMQLARCLAGTRPLAYEQRSSSITSIASIANGAIPHSLTDRRR